MCDDALSNVSGMDTSPEAKSSYLEVSNLSAKPDAYWYEITTGQWDYRHPILFVLVLHCVSCSSHAEENSWHAGSEL